MTEREKAHKALAHALAALEDMPAPFMWPRRLARVGVQLSAVNDIAYHALHQSVQSLRCFKGSDQWGRLLPALRRAAPGLLDALCDLRGLE